MEKNNNIDNIKKNLEDIKKEFYYVLEIAEKAKVVHKEIAEKANISIDYLRKIRRGERLKVENEKNMNYYKKLIDIYLDMIKKRKETINSFKIK